MYQAMWDFEYVVIINHVSSRYDGRLFLLVDLKERVSKVKASLLCHNQKIVRATYPNPPNPPEIHYLTTLVMAEDFKMDMRVVSKLDPKNHWHGVLGRDILSTRSTIDFPNMTLSIDDRRFTLRYGHVYGHFRNALIKTNLMEHSNRNRNEENKRNRILEDVANLEEELNFPEEDFFPIENETDDDDERYGRGAPDDDESGLQDEAAFLR